MRDMLRPLRLYSAPAFLLFVCVTSTADAQDGFGGGWIDVSEGTRKAMLQQETLRQIMPKVRGPAASVPHRMSASLSPSIPSTRASADPALMRFTRSPAITKQVTERFVAISARTMPDQREAMASYFRSGSPLKAFDHAMTVYGLDPRNLADVLTAYYISTWEAVNAGAIDRTQAMKIRNGLAPYLAATPEMRKSTDARKQEAAETYAILAMLTNSTHEDLKKRGDRKALADFREEIYRAVLREGVDLRRLQVTDRGFVMR